MSSEKLIIIAATVLNSIREMLHPSEELIDNTLENRLSAALNRSS